MSGFEQGGVAVLDRPDVLVVTPDIDVAPSPIADLSGNERADVATPPSERVVGVATRSGSAAVRRTLNGRAKKPVDPVTKTTNGPQGFAFQSSDSE